MSYAHKVAFSIYALLTLKPKTARGAAVAQRSLNQRAGPGSEGVPFLLGPGGNGGIQRGTEDSSGDDGSDDPPPPSSVAKNAKTTAPRNSPSPSSATSPSSTNSSSASSGAKSSSASTSVTSATSSIEPASSSISTSSSHSSSPLSTPAIYSAGEAPPQPSSIRYLAPVFLIIFATIVIIIVRKIRKRRKAKRLGMEDTEVAGTRQRDGLPPASSANRMGGAGGFGWGRGGGGGGWKEIRSDENHDDYDDDDEKIWYAGEEDCDDYKYAYGCGQKENGGGGRPVFRSDDLGNGNGDCLSNYNLAKHAASSYNNTHTRDRNTCGNGNGNGNVNININGNLSVNDFGNYSNGGGNGNGVVSVTSKGWFRDNFTFGNWRSARGRELIGAEDGGEDGGGTGLNEMGQKERRTVKLVTPRSTSTYTSLPNAGKGGTLNVDAKNDGDAKGILVGGESKGERPGSGGQGEGERYGLDGQLIEGETRGSIRALKDRLWSLTGRVSPPRLPNRDQEGAGDDEELTSPNKLLRAKAANKRRFAPKSDQVDPRDNDKAKGKGKDKEKKSKRLNVKGTYANGAQLDISTIPPPSEPAWIRPRSAMSPSSTLVLSPPLQPHLFFAAPSMTALPSAMVLEGFSESGSEYTDLASVNSVSGGTGGAPAVNGGEGAGAGGEHGEESQWGLSDIPSTAEALENATGILSPRTPTKGTSTTIGASRTPVRAQGGDDETPKAKARGSTTLRNKPTPRTGTLTKTPTASSLRESGTTTPSRTKSSIVASGLAGMRRSEATKDLNLGRSARNGAGTTSALKGSTPIRSKSTIRQQKKQNQEPSLPTGQDAFSPGPASGPADTKHDGETRAETQVPIQDPGVSSPTPTVTVTSPTTRKSRVQRKQEQARDQVEDILKASWSDRAMSSPMSEAFSSPSIDGLVLGMGMGMAGIKSPGVEQVGGIEQRLGMVRPPD